MERDFIQDGIERYEERKEALKQKHSEELANNIQSRYKAILEKYYGTSLTEEERDKKIEETYNKYLEKTIQDEENRKRQEIAGRTYTSKEILKEKIIGGLIFATLILLTVALRHSIKDSELLSKYSEMRSDMTADFTPVEESKLDPITKEDLKELKQAIKDYDGPYTYRLSGDRTDGTHNDYYRFDGESFVQVSDKELDPIERLVKEEVREITKDRVPVLQPKAAGSVGIKEGFGEPIGSGRTR